MFFRCLGYARLNMKYVQKAERIPSSIPELRNTNVWSSPGKGHFPVSVGQLNSWVRAIKISLFKAKKKN